MMQVWHWLVDQNNAPIVGALGLLLSGVGFPITVYQLVGTKRAARAARDETIRIERSINRYEVINEASKASTALSTARNYLRSDLWPHVADSYEIVKDGLEALRSDAAELNDNHRQQIDQAVIYIKHFALALSATD